MTENRIEFQYAGLNEGDLTLDALVRELKAVSCALEAVDRALHHKKASEFYVVDARHNSPLCLAIEGAALDLHSDTTATIAETVHLIHCIKRHTWPSRYGAELKQEVMKLFSGLGKHVEKIDISWQDNRQSLTLKDIEKDAQPKDSYGYVSSVTGRVEYLDIHNQTNSFKIYPIAGAESILCKFKLDLKEEVLAAIDQIVTVSGTFKHKGNAMYPHLIKVEALEIHQPSEFNLIDLKGTAPDITGDLRSEVYVRQLRDEWDQGRDII